MARTYRTRLWVSREPDPATCLTLAETLAINPITAQVLYNRGLSHPEQARAFLESGRDGLHSPVLLTDLDRAVALLRPRAAAGGPVLVWGDYDVDGITGTAILVSVLRSLGAAVDYHIPNRFTEGYGLNTEGLKRWAAAGYDLVVTVDTGIGALAEAEQARALGLTLIITDHHEPGPELPAAAAVINPKRPDCPYPFRGLSGAGVAFKLAQALLGQDSRLWEYLDIVALATVADLVPLVGENRILVKEGLEWLARTRRVGLVALKELAGIQPGTVSAGQVAFGLGPRLNALGRMGEARAGVELLLTDDAERARALAAQVDEENRARQSVQEAILQGALAQLEAQPAADRSHAVVLAGEGWHAGVVGICAAKVVEATYRPTVLLTIEGDEARGSARSIPGFHLFRALQACSDLLLKFGGHAMAAGLTLRTADINRLRERLNQLAREWLRAEDLVPRLELDAWVAPEQLGPQLAEELARLEPYGLGNPEPCLACAGLRVLEARPVGRTGGHLKLRLQGAAGYHDAIGFGLAQPGAPGEVPLRPGSTCKVAFRPEINVWNGSSRFQLVLTDLVTAGPTAAVDPGGGETVSALLAWDPLHGLATEPPARVAPVFAPLPPDPAAPDDGWAAAVATLAASGPVLLLVASPWLVTPVREQVQARLRTTGGGRVHVQAWGALPPSTYAAAVALHPPFHLGQAAAAARQAATLYGAWTEADWDRAEVVLGWPYPDRPQLVRVWKLLAAAGCPAAVTTLAAQLAGGGLEPLGPWNLLRVHAAARVLAEIGLVGHAPGDLLHILPASNDTRGKMNLNGSPRYRTGLAGRAALQQARQALGLPGLPGQATTTA